MKILAHHLKQCSPHFKLAVGIASLLILAGGAVPVLGAEDRSLLSKAAPPESEANSAARVAQKQAQLRQVRPENYDLQQHPITDAQEKHWRNILWTTGIVEPQTAYVAQALNRILTLAPRSDLSASQRRTLDMAFQVGTQLYLNHPNVYGALGQQFVQTVTEGSEPRFVAVALSALAKSTLMSGQVQQLSERVRQRFPQWSQNLSLRTTLLDVNERISPSAVPPLRDLLRWTVAPGQVHLYVICTRDRNALCTTLLKDRQGQFVRTAGAGGAQQLWSAPLLLRSIHGLGWNFTRGETPQGIYRIEGTVPQPDNEFFRAYGQFSLVNLYVPFESGVRAFVPGRPGMFSGSLSDYESLLPPSWRSYAPIQQSYWAGRIGRGLFRIHGSGEDPNFFSKLQRDGAAAAWNPTLGCLSALELYDSTGRLQQADMPKILSALTLAGGPNFSGYLIVAEVPQASQSLLSAAALEAATP